MCRFWGIVRFGRVDIYFLFLIESNYLYLFFGFLGEGNRVFDSRFVYKSIFLVVFYFVIGGFFF